MTWHVLPEWVTICAVVDIVREPLEPGISVVAVSGAADSAATTALREAVQEALAEPGWCLIVDLTAASFVDSAMLGILAASFARVRPPDGAAPRMAIVCPEGNVRAMFEITALDTLMPVVGTLERARDVIRPA